MDEMVESRLGAGGDLGEQENSHLSAIRGEERDVWRIGRANNTLISQGSTGCSETWKWQARNDATESMGGPGKITEALERVGVYWRLCGGYRNRGGHRRLQMEK